MISHELKCWPEFFRYAWTGRKPFEIRRNDRRFDVGDQIVLREWNDVAQEYTGRSLTGVIIYITAFMQPLDFVVFSYRETDRRPDRRLTPR